MPASRLRAVVSRLVLTTLVLALAGVQPRRALADPVQFESPPVHPLEIAGDELYVTNMPDNRLSIFDLSTDTPVLVGEVRVGLEPVSVRRAADGLVWVVDHLSDDVAIVDPQQLELVDTIPVGDEPADVAFVDDPFAPGSQWAVITLSQENRVVVLQTKPPYTQVASIDMPGSEPRAMAVTPNGQKVWIAMFESGNNTSLVTRTQVADPLSPWGGVLPPFDPPLNPSLPDSLLPTNGVVVRQHQDGRWLDEQDGDWSPLIGYTLDDVDAVLLDCSGSPTITKQIRGVGNLVEDLTVDPVTGDLWLVNVEAHNDVLFEPKLQGAFATNRVSVVRNGLVEAEPHPLNGSLDPLPVPEMAAEDALASPNEIIFATVAGGITRMFVTSIGGRRIAVIDPASGNIDRRLRVAEGASGLVHHGASDRLIMANRFDNSLHVVHPVQGDLGIVVPIGRSGWDPTPADIRDGRRFLYTGSQSATGGLSCHTCHPHATMDGLAWDLGDPSGDMVENPANPNGKKFHPLKGPMVTQTLRGLKDTEPFHWRGDRVDFQAFNPAFDTLLGGQEIPASDMDDYAAFILSVVYPPNPFLNLDDSLPATLNGGDPSVGLDIFLNNNNGFCQSCHVVEEGGTKDRVIFLGPNLGNQLMNVAQLRNMYEKTGFDDLFGVNMRGFGYLHDGDAHNLEFVIEDVLGNRVPDGNELDMEALLMSFPTGTHAATGAQITLDGNRLANATSAQRHATLEQAAATGGIDLIAHGTLQGENRGLVWTPSGYSSDRFGEIWSWPALASEMQLNGARLTFLGVPPGEGIRMGIDRDLDGARDRDELDQGTDPADPNDTATAAPPTFEQPDRLDRVTSIFPAPFSSRTQIEVYVSQPTRAEVIVYDLRGRSIRQLADRELPAGRHGFDWDGRDGRGRVVAAGTYFVQLRTPHGAPHSRKVTRLP